MGTSRRVLRFAIVASLMLTGNAVPSRLDAQSDSTPQIVIDGFKALQAKGIRSAVDVWFKGSSLETDTTSVAYVTGQFDSLPKWLGRPSGYEIVKTTALGLHIRRTYALLLFTGGPMYFRFEYYLSPGGWIVQHFDFNTDRDKIFPPSLLPS